MIDWEISEDDTQLRPHEAVCTACHYTYNKHLPVCPDCDGEKEA